MLDAIFGGLSSSRLFQAVREERGLAYSVYSFTAQFIDTGEIGLYVGTRPDNLAEAMEIVAAELDRLRSEGVTEEELVRARENVKARIVLGLESAGARMSRLGASVLYGLPLLEIDEIMARIDAVTLEDLRALVEELWVPEALSAAGIGPDEAAFTDAVAPRLPGRGAARGVTRVAVAGAAGRMGQAVCAAVEGADDLELIGRADPALGVDARPTCSFDADVVVDFTQPDQALGNARECLDAGVHVVIGTTGFDLDELRSLADGRLRQRLRRPQLRDRRGADDALRGRGVEAHGRRRDHRVPPRRPSSTSRRAPPRGPPS